MQVFELSQCLRILSSDTYSVLRQAPGLGVYQWLMEGMKVKQPKAHWPVTLLSII